MFNLPKNQSGQALLLVLLSMAVALTLVLSVLSRTISDVKISSQDENSQRAFSAAEAGVEQALVVGSDTGSVDIGDAKFSAKVSDFAEGKDIFVFPSTFVSGEPAVVWFVSHDANGNPSCSGAENPCFKGDRIKICWGDNTAAPVPALEASIVYLNTAGNYSTARIARAAFDDNVSRRSSNNFVDPGGSCTIGTNTFQYSTTLNFSSFTPQVPYGIGAENKPQFMVLKLLYNNTAHHIGVSVAGSGSVLPSQGQLIESSGASGDANRSINVFQGYGELPLAFYSAIYSKGGLTKP